MKSRRVVITIELKSALPLKILKQDIKGALARLHVEDEVLQIQANVIQKKK